jgi:hypothetical protein
LGGVKLRVEVLPVSAGSLDWSAEEAWLREESGEDSPHIDKEHHKRKTGEKIFEKKSVALTRWPPSATKTNCPPPRDVTA